MNPRTQYRQCMPVYVHALAEKMLGSSIIRKHSLMSRFINYEQSSIKHYKTIQQLINAYLGDQLPSNVILRLPIVAL